MADIICLHEKYPLKQCIELGWLP